MKLRSMLLAGFSVILISGCNSTEESKQESNTSKVSKPESEPLIELSNFKIDYDGCLLKIDSTDPAKQFDTEYINFKRVASFKSRAIDANGNQHHVLYFDERAVAMVEVGQRNRVELTYTQCAKRM